MYQRLSSQEKIGIIRRIKAGEPVLRLSRQYGLSRTVIYRWLRKYQKATGRAKIKVLGSKIAQGTSHWRHFPAAIERKIVKIALGNPRLSPKSLAKLCGISAHGVWNVLARHKLSTIAQRENYLLRYGASLVRLRLPSDKLTMVRRYEAGEKVTTLCREFKVSRAIFYRWLARY